MVGSAVPPHRLTLAAAVPVVPAMAAGTFLYVALMDIVVNEFNVRVRDRTPRLVAWTHTQRPLLHALLEDENSFCQNSCTKRLAAVTAAVLCVEHDLLSEGKRVQAGLLLRRDAQGARKKRNKCAHPFIRRDIYTHRRCHVPPLPPPGIRLVARSTSGASWWPCCLALVPWPCSACGCEGSVQRAPSRVRGLKI